MSSETAVRADAVTVAYERQVRLRDVTLGVRSGQLLAVTGSAGAGKTTLLWALAGLLPLAGGSVTIGASGHPSHARSRADRSRSAQARSAWKRVGSSSAVVLLPQGDGLAGVLSARENVQLPLLAAGLSAAAADERADAALHAVGLGEAGGQLIEELSGGQQQRVCLARGLARRGAVVLADEPTSALDAHNRTLVMALLRAEAERGAAVLVATHDPEAAAECDGELHLDDGDPTWIRFLS